jgi:hypothetical protein
MTQKLSRVLGLGAVALAVVAALVVLFPAAQSTSAQPLPPNRFFGKATASGQPAAGAAIAALVGGTNCGSATADGSGNYRLDVLSSGERPGCGTDGATVTFTVAGQRASQTGTWKQGEFTPLDLSGAPAATATATTPPATATATTPPAATATAPVATATAAPPVATATAVTPVLPRTGTAGGDSGMSWLMLAIAGLVVLGAGSVLAVRRSRS